ncbi:40S ribosomal protein S14-3-like [Forsythia ovata]|uniref:40S ribosomal protein S14-3-like n=1 Tax=Forsythia ovata TaxID=205694 RepID=A0ABD1S1C8_9LAMI
MYFWYLISLTESKRRTREPKEENITLGPSVRDGELVFGVAHIFASFNDTFIRRLCFYDRQLCRIRNLLSAEDNVDQTHSALLCQCAQTSFSDFSPSSALSLICRPILTSTLQSHCLPRSIRGQVRYIGVSNETSYGVMEFIHVAKNEGLP